MIALDYVPNYDFVTCQDWIEWINQQEIALGQPCVKEDKRSRLMPLESRVKCTCLVQPANARFNRDIRRLYLPRSVEQFMLFLMAKAIELNLKVYINCFEVSFETFCESDKDLMKILGKLIQYLKKVKRLK